jgi:hypothetical protein
LLAEWAAAITVKKMAGRANRKLARRNFISTPYWLRRKTPDFGAPSHSCFCITLPLLRVQKTSGAIHELNCDLNMTLHSQIGAFLLP